MNNIILLLKEISHISNYHKRIAHLSGENFNVFKTLNLANSEVRMHSAILCEFLNPQGSHGQGDLFLKIFTEQFHILDFETNNASVVVEKDVGSINDDYTEGGRIDILITDSVGKHIIIENKINAGDQKNQLLRYHNFDPKAKLFYLNLFGNEPSDFTTDSKLSSDSYQVISYHSDILKWLDNCKKEAASLPVIRETIVQYMNLIKFLTNQTVADKMKTEIKDLIIKNPEYVESIELCAEALQSIVDETNSEFFKLLAELFPSYTINLHDEMSIFVRCNEDADGLFVGYQLKKGEENIGSSAIAMKYSNILKEIEPSMNYNSWHIGWFNPKPFIRRQRFSNLDKKFLIEMNQNRDSLIKFIKDLKECEKEITNKFLIRIQSTH